MATEAIPAPCEPAEDSLIQANADSVNRTSSDVALGDPEAMANRQAYQAALAADDGIRYSTDEVMRMALATD